MSTHRLILASSSPYRKRLIDQLGLSCEQLSPDVDESPMPEELPDQMALRLAAAKALAVSERIPAGSEDYLIVASDQVCHLNGRIFHKPVTHDVASEHLRAFSGQWVTFSTSIVLQDHQGKQVACTEDYRIHFRDLAPGKIDAYLRQDQPYDCAGATKVESAGIMLLDNAEGRDINSLYGLPLMGLIDLLEQMQLSIDNFK